jgi:hypothetical protein
MNKKCVICGIELDENAPVCPKCGTNQSTHISQTPPESNPPAESPAPEKKKPKTLSFILGGAAVLLIVVVVLFCIFGDQIRRAIDPLEACKQQFANYLVLKNCEGGDIDAMVPDAVWDYLANNNYTTKEEVRAKYLGYYQQKQKSLWSMYGENTRTSGEVLSIDPIDQELQENILRQMPRFGLHKEDITAIRQLTVSITVTTPVTSWTSENTEHYFAFQMDGNWYVFYFRPDYSWDNLYLILF